jgi:hypothetical protein
VLRKDQQVFLDFVSGQNPRIENALLELKARERGHFEDHPAVKPLVVSSLSDKNLQTSSYCSASDEHQGKSV